jgi:hypothetical protein
MNHHVLAFIGFMRFLALQTTYIMNRALSLLTLFLFTLSAFGQFLTSVPCEELGLVVSASDSNVVNIYHPGSYLIHPSESNVMIWTVTDGEGNVIVQDTLVGESGLSFEHDVLVTDSMFVSVQLTNDSADFNGDGVDCLIDDVLVWEEVEVLGEVAFGNWEFGGSTGVDVSDLTTFECGPNAVIPTSSDTGSVWFFHAGSFYTSPLDSNVLVWTFVDGNGTVLLEDTVVGEYNYGWTHDVPLSDTITYSVTHTNNVALQDSLPVNCQVTGALVWHEMIIGDVILTGWVPVLSGCNNPSACNYNMNATEDDGSCAVPGDACDDGNEDTEEDVLLEDCSCEGTPVVDAVKEPSVLDVALFPVPVQHEVMLQFSKPNSAPVLARVLDSSGRIMMEVTVPPGQSQLTFKAHDWLVGMYLVHLQSKDGTWTSRLIKN